MLEHFCQQCYILFTEKTCPNCQNKARPPEPYDLIFYLRADYFTSARIEDFLKEKAIPYMKKGQLGAGLTSRIGMSFERESFFIPYEAYKDHEDELEILKEVINNPEEV